jgi:hypothetical protein
MRIPAVLLSLSAAAALYAGAANASLITNGGFELTGNGSNKQLSSSPLDRADRTTLTGWTSSNGNDGGYNFVLDSTIMHTNASAIAFRSENNGYSMPAGAGNVFASDAQYYPGVLSQTINGLTVGLTYTLSFDYAVGQQAGFDGINQNNQWQVKLGGDTRMTEAIDLAAGGFSGWKSATMEFTATSASEVLSFLALGGSRGGPPFMLLDNVALDANQVPEPATWALFLGGAGLLAARRRRSQA